jgi:hypothetical protein
MKVVQAGGETLFAEASSPQSLYAELANTCMKNAIPAKPPPLAGRVSGRGQNQDEKAEKRLFRPPQLIGLPSAVITGTILGSDIRARISFPVLTCVMGEDKVASFDRLVAGEAGFVHRLVGRFAVFIELSEAPAARRGVSS